MSRSGNSCLRAVGLVAIALAIAACGDKPQDGKGPPAEGRGGGGGKGGRGGGPTQFPVEVQVVEAAPVEFAVHAVGSVEAFETVQVTARVAGAVEKVRFTEGQEVKAGDVIAEIEPRRYQLAVRSAQATLERAQAMVTEARAALERREKVNRENPGLIRGEELETFRTQAATAAAEVAQAQVALEQAQLNLRDAYVKAPVAGVLQTRSVQTGQYVQVGAVLATVTQREPLLLRFQVPQDDAGRLAVGGSAKFKIGAGDAPIEAKITHIAAEANAESRMVAVTAEVDPEAAKALRPGSFAEVTVPVATITAPVISQTAVRPSERGFLAFVVEGDQAKERILELGMRTPDGRVEVRGGVKPGEQLVIRGAEALRDGAQVRVVPSPVNPSGPPTGDVPQPHRGNGG